ncbi:hypothetical protein [Egbenema bharatensis]|uniref:hypothetical protein n=1 Tax=Egbenema bharatensis TaxID=3463334 RepID=UPI003A8476E6
MMRHQSSEKAKTIFGLSRRAVSSLGVITLGLSVSLLSACQPPTQEDQTVGNGTVTTEDVTDATPGDPAIGELVTIRSGVTDILSQNGFVVESEGGDPVVIVSETPFQLPDQEVPLQVTGELQTLDTTQAQQYGIEPNVAQQYDQQPAIIAQSVALAPRPQDFWDAPEGTFINQPVAVEGDLRRLEETNNAFALFEEGWANDVGVLVIGVDQFVDTAQLEDGENIVVTGQAQPISEQLLRDANLDWTDAQMQEFIARYTNRPVIVADQVYPSAVPPHPTL